MRPPALVTAGEMRGLDRATIESGHATGGSLMERAGSGVVEAMERRYGSLLGLRVLVLCGTGNNGSDGFVVARGLRARGAEPHVGLLGDPECVAGDARAQMARLDAIHLPVARIDSEAALAALISARDRWDFAVDALLGTGARGAPEGLVAAGVQALRELDEGGTRVVAVDLPTGVDADSGAIARRAVRADITVTFGFPKRGHLLYPGRAFVGTLAVVDIGLAPAAIEAAALPVRLGSPAAMAARLPIRDPRAHKTSVGRVLIVGGSPGLGGAVVLAARAAMRAGAGYVQCAVPASLLDGIAARLVEPMPLPFPETAARTLAPAAAPALRELARHAGAMALGSGLSREPASAELVRTLVADPPCALVLDADGLNAFAGMPDSLVSAGGEPRVLTPHLGEMARLTGIDAATLEAGRIDLAREWAVRWKSVLVLKGAPTVVAAPDGTAEVNPTGNPGLATAGTGDVLTGMIAALIAQGLEPFDAAALGVYLHGLAGDLAAGAHAPGLIASDVIEGLRGAFAATAGFGRAAGPRG